MLESFLALNIISIVVALVSCYCFVIVAAVTLLGQGHCCLFSRSLEGYQEIHVRSYERSRAAT